jgi:hypothetical protein
MMHKVVLSHRMRLIFVIHFIILFGFAVHCFGGKVEEFSAEQVLLDPSGNIQQAGKLYVSTDKIRVEQPQAESGGSMVIIFRKDLQVVRILMPEAKMYIENPLNEGDLQKAMQQIPENVKEVDLGAETVNGFECRKKQIEGTVETFGGQKQTFRSIVWVSERMGLPIRTQGEDGHITELRNIKTGHQPGDLFELPSGYTKAANILDAMGGLSGESGN